jgi:hypothetical protein
MLKHAHVRCLPMGAIYRFAAKMFELTNWPRVIHILTSLPKLVAYLSNYSLEDILREKKSARRDSPPGLRETAIDARVFIP